MAAEASPWWQQQRAPGGSSSKALVAVAARPEVPCEGGDQEKLHAYAQQAETAVAPYAYIQLV